MSLPWQRWSNPSESQGTLNMDDGSRSWMLNVDDEEILRCEWMSLRWQRWSNPSDSHWTCERGRRWIKSYKVEAQHDICCDLFVNDPNRKYFFFNHTLLLPIEHHTLFNSWIAPVLNILLLSTLTLVYSALFNSWIAPVLNVLLLSTLTLVYATIYTFIPDCFSTSSEKCAYVTLITNCSWSYPCAWKMCVAGTGTWIIFELEQIGTRLTSTSPGSPSLHPITTQSLHCLNY